MTPRTAGYAIAARRWRMALSAFGLAIGVVHTALAQAPAPSADTAIAAYREYRAAIERDDWVAAESPAERAWRAAEASGLPPGRTGALALNLAITRLRLDRQADAVEPARRALALSEAGAREVDRLTARLVLGEALLATNFEEGEGLLTPALAEAAQAGAANDVFAFRAARALGKSALAKRNWNLAMSAWESAFRHAAGAPYEIELARAEALIGRGIALAWRHKDAEAYEFFVRAGALVAPLAPEREDDTVTVGQYFYARALVWSSVVGARLRSERPRSAPRGYDLPARPQLPGRPPLCPLSLDVSPLPTYPRDAVVGAVVVRLSISADGEVRSHEVLAAVPSDDFARAVDSQRLHWRVSRAPQALTGCRMETHDVLVTFRFEF